MDTFDFSEAMRRLTTVPNTRVLRQDWRNVSHIEVRRHDGEPCLAIVMKSGYCGPYAPGL
jgi:hypothetical protein